MSHKQVLSIILLTALISLPFAQVLAADDGDWKKGRIYYRMTCTACHKEMNGGNAISPVSMTIEQWQKYVAADKHDASGNSNSSLKYYVSKEYRNSVKDSNKAAAKYIDMSEEELLASVRAFVIHGAKDSDTPARCQ